MIVKILIALLILIIGIGFGTMILCVLGWDETTERERWSRSLDEPADWPKRYGDIIKADDIPIDDEWMQEDEWDEIYKREVENDSK